jgi:hypothetical protein
LEQRSHDGTVYIALAPATPRRPTTRERKAATAFKPGNDPRRNIEAGPKKLVAPVSEPPVKRDSKVKNAASTIGKVAAGAGVSRYKAEGKVKGAAADSSAVPCRVRRAARFWNQCFSARKADERRQIRELAVKVALENWKIYKEASDRLGVSMQPIDSFLVHAVQMVSALDGSLTTNEQIRCHLRRCFDASDAADNEINERNKRLREERKKGAA